MQQGGIGCLGVGLTGLGCCSVVVGMRVASSGMQEGARVLGEEEEECDI